MQRKQGEKRKVGLGVILSLLLIGCSPTYRAIVEPIRIAQAESANIRQTLPISARATIAGREFELEVARTPQQQEIGLMNRTSLADNRGMLFLFSSPQPIRFWMKNTLIPLDMIFLRDGKVVAIAPAVPPCKTPSCPTYGANSNVDRVIELRSGIAKEIGLKVGEQIKIKFSDSR